MIHNMPFSSLAGHIYYIAFLSNVISLSKHLRFRIQRVTFETFELSRPAEIDNRQHDWLRVMPECYLQAADIIVWSRSKSCLLRLSSPERARLQELQESILASESANQTCTVAPPPLGSSSPSKENLVLYVPEVEEIRISPVIARKGYLNVLEHKTNGWKKRWVVRSLSLNTSLPCLAYLSNKIG